MKNSLSTLINQLLPDCLSLIQNLKSESRASHFYRKIGLKQKTMRNWKRSIMKQFSNLTIPLLQLVVMKLNLKIAIRANFHSYSKETLTMIVLLSQIVQELKRRTLYHGVQKWFMKIKLILRDKTLIVQLPSALDVSFFEIMYIPKSLKDLNLKPSLTSQWKLVLTKLCTRLCLH